MTKSQYELIIIGAGVVGMGAALAAHKKGIKKILVIDRHQACTGASIRNFGFITNGASSEVDAKKSLTVPRNMARSCQKSKNYC